MAIIYTYPRLSGQPEGSDLVLITDVSDDNKSKNTTIQSINDLGPQGTVTDVDLTMPAGYVVDKTVTSGDISFVVSGFPTELPADDPANSVQFNLSSTLTGVAGFEFIEDRPNEGNTLFLGGPIAGLRKQGTINLYDQGTIALWANTSSNKNQRVAITGPRGLVADSSQASYQFALPGYRPNAPYGDTGGVENPPPSYTEPRVLVVDGTQYTTAKFDSSWFKVTDLPGLGPAGNDTEIQFNNAGVFGADPGLSIDISTTRTRLDLGHRLNPTGRGEINIHSGARNLGYTQGGVLDLEYSYPTSAPTNPTSGAAAYAFVGLIGPEYDENLVPGDPDASYGLQGYSIQLPVVTPVDSTQTTYNDARLLVVNGATTGADPIHESKWITPGELGIGVGGIQNSIQFNDSNALAGDSYFTIETVNDPGHIPGGRLELAIGSPNLSTNEPYGSILLNGGNNSDEGGVIRLASATSNKVGITGPQTSPNPVADYIYDFSLPTKSPEQTDVSFNEGVNTIDIDQGGTGYTAGTQRLATTSSGTGEGCTVNVTNVVTDPVTGDTGIVFAVDVQQPGEGYTVGEILTIVAGDGNATIEVMSVDGYKNKVLVASSDKAFGRGTENLYESRWVDANDLGISGGSDLVIEDEGTGIAATATTINFTGGGVSAAADPNDANKVNVEIPPRLSQGFSPFPIYLGDDIITVNQGSTLAIACNTICDIASGQITVARVFGDISQNTRINVAVYSGELGDASATQLIAYGTAPATAGVSGKIYRINLNDMLPNPTTGLTPTWSPVAGTPIVVVIEIDNRSGDGSTTLLGKEPPQGGVQGLFGDRLSFSIAGVSSVFDSTNIAAGTDVEQLLGFLTDKEDTSIRVCHHFDPFAP